MEPIPSERNRSAWMRWILIAAGLYNLAWGAACVLYPTALFRWAEMEIPRYPQIWQCVGMIVGVYGIGYLIASSDPVRHWPITLVGLLGKVFGPNSGDLFQLPGVFLLEHGTVTAAFRAGSPADRPDYQEILAAARTQRQPAIPPEPPPAGWTA